MAECVRTLPFRAGRPEYTRPTSGPCPGYQESIQGNGRQQQKELRGVSNTACNACNKEYNDRQAFKQHQNWDAQTGAPAQCTLRSLTPPLGL